MKYTGHLKKMIVEAGREPGSKVKYLLPLDDEKIPLNSLIGQSIHFNYLGHIHCVECGRKTSKSYNQGFCYPCFQSLASCDMCIMKPETCHYYENTCRQPEWGEEHCMQDHYVYLANSSGIKVGITRGTQVPIRWIDQGASEALPIFRVSERLISGKVEVAIKKHVSDRTDWRKMLKGQPESVDLKAKRDELVKAAAQDIAAVIKEFGDDKVQKLDEDIRQFHYPVDSYPEKVKSLNFDKTPEISGQLQGIKGQYLILDSGVLNIRKFAGYEIEFSTD